ncbi:N-acetylmuramoyl-L-alanine amidase, partial [Streptomyces sp. JJ36]|nr:N-acetylmuramoyl-L-alanine amidase [Streptomyces sp. JJ36]
FAVIRQGARRTTDSGQRVTLPARPGVRPRTGQLDALGLPVPRRHRDVECPRTLSCTWIPAPYEQWTGDDGSTHYGNHDTGNRPESQEIEYIVVHDTEATWETTLDLVQDPAYVSWHYSLRSSDGRVAQHLRTKDVG